MLRGWRPRLVEALRERPSPVLLTDEGTIPGASLWIGSRRWVTAFRAAGLRPGERVVLALPPSAAFVEVLVAALWEGLTVAPVPVGADTDTLLDQLDAALVIVPAAPGRPGRLQPGRWGADGCSGPSPHLAGLRPTRSAPTPAASLLLSTSGTTGSPRWIALSERNVCSVLDSHQSRLALTDAHVISVLPWYHAFGLILDLLPALLAGAYLVRDPSGGRDTSSLADLVRRAPAALSGVPATFAALAALPDGAALLASLTGGIVGGASVDADLAERLSGTALRPGYGQTEASPGIALGDPGRWQAHLLGRPLGCEVRLVDGALEFRGENANLGVWDANGLQLLDPNRWVATNDAVDLVSGELFYRGRTVDRFKLANGRWIDTAAIEPRLVAALTQASDAVLFTGGGSALDVLLVARPGSSRQSAQDAGIVRDVLGPLAALLGEIRYCTPDDVVRDGKGALNRTATVLELLS